MENQENTLSDNYLSRVLKIYGEIIPNELEVLALYLLYTASKRQGFTGYFEYSEIKQAVVRSSKFQDQRINENLRVERAFKRLLGAFIERIPNNYSRYVLTPHTDRIIETLINRIKNPYLKFPLKETFETYFQLPEDAKENLVSLQRWFKMGFQDTARQVVIGHLEALKIAVDDAVKELNSVLEQESLSATEMLEKFEGNFHKLGEKAHQIGEAIQIKNTIYYSIRSILDSIIGEIDTYRIPENNEEREQYQQLVQKRVIVNNIKTEVNDFFEKIDLQLDLVNTRLTFASQKITELQDSFKTESHYKMSIKRMLIYLLENSITDDDKVILPVKFPKKGIVQQKFKFRTIRYWDMGNLKKGLPYVHQFDKFYEDEEREKIEMELSKQERIHEFHKKALMELNSTGELNMSKKIMEILDQGNQLDTAIQTGYEILLNLSNDVDILIDEGKLESKEQNNIYIWKVILQKKGNLTS